ncbi:MAG: cell division protein FtsQ [Candidatus Melainabacteria bacterium]|nr:cell division protein FtsQ [Candidatus Melainabacteria bacterium]
MPSKKPLVVEVVKNKIVDDIDKVCICRKVEELILNKNFFLISPRHLSQKLLESIPFLQKVVVRKYLIPEYRLIIYVKEKPVWATSGDFKLISDDGEVGSSDCLNLSLLPKKMITVSGNNISSLKKDELVLVKKIVEVLQERYKLLISRLLIDDENQLEIYTESGFKIKAGKINPDLFEKILKLEKVLDELKQRSYLLEYIDLGLENIWVFKEQVKKDNKIRLFKRN